MYFLLDENVPIALVALLEAAGHDVVHVAQSSFRSAADPELWRIAAESGRIIVTMDLDFPLPESPTPEGLVLIRVPRAFHPRNIPAMFSDFMVSQEFGQLSGNIVVVAPGNYRVRPLQD